MWQATSINRVKESFDYSGTTRDAIEALQHFIVQSLYGAVRIHKEIAIAVEFTRVSEAVCINNVAIRTMARDSKKDLPSESCSNNLLCLR